MDVIPALHDSYTRLPQRVTRCKRVRRVGMTVHGCQRLRSASVGPILLTSLAPRRLV